MLDVLMHLGGKLRKCCNGACYSHSTLVVGEAVDGGINQVCFIVLHVS